MLRPLLLSAVAVAIATAFAPLPSPLRASPRTLAATATGSEHLLGHGDPSHVPSKLQAITAEVAGAIPAAKAVRSEGDLEAAVAAFDAELGAPVDLFARLRRESAGTARRVALAAEFKRASPSKGPIALDLDAAEQAVKYAGVGAAVVSVLTEPAHFKGTLADLLAARRATQATRGAADRPAMLRKDFIVDEYQLLEARAHGADTILLIVAVLPAARLAALTAAARALGMEPLVEVHTDAEMHVALDCGATVIGINNRNLHTFELDLGTTARVSRVASGRGYAFGPDVVAAPGAEKQIVLMALSGISRSDDVDDCRAVGVEGVLVGEALMRAADPQAAIVALLDAPEAAAPPVVKVCGVTTADDARAAVEANANLIGVIFAAKSKRRVSAEQARSIVGAVRAFGERTDKVAVPLPTDDADAAARAAAPGAWFARSNAALRRACSRTPLVVGVFQDAPVDEVVEVAKAVGLDCVQLHGAETPEDAARVAAEAGVAVLRVVHVAPGAADADLDAAVAGAARGGAAAVLFDTAVSGAAASGGAGEVFDWGVVERLSDRLGVAGIVAGGLGPDNVGAAVAMKGGVFGVDAAGGTEAGPGIKDRAKVAAYVAGAVVG